VRSSVAGEWVDGEGCEAISLDSARPDDVVFGQARNPAT
jgi:hypothetical protein